MYGSNPVATDESVVYRSVMCGSNPVTPEALVAKVALAKVALAKVALAKVALVAKVALAKVALVML